MNLAYGEIVGLFFNPEARSDRGGNGIRHRWSKNWNGRVVLERLPFRFGFERHS